MEREFFIDNLLVRINYIIVMIRRTGLAPWEEDMDLRRGFRAVVGGDERCFALVLALHCPPQVGCRQSDRAFKTPHE